MDATLSKTRRLLWIPRWIGVPAFLDLMHNGSKKPAGKVVGIDQPSTFERVLKVPKPFIPPTNYFSSTDEVTPLPLPDHRNCTASTVCCASHFRPRPYQRTGSTNATSTYRS
jgi:hypothetical protein